MKRLVSPQRRSCVYPLTRNSKDFEDLALHLSPCYRVICPKPRGRGLSVMPGAAATQE
jgi:hypothetical protein